MLQVRRLQQWWRECSAKLRSIKELITRRWVALENLEVEKLQRGGDENALPLDDDLRSNFLDNELRAMRYLVLPRIELWEVERQRWAKSISERAEQRAALKVLGQKLQASPEDSFSWPPSRPSYLPPRHPNHHAHSRDCPEDCCGRLGDRMMLAMIERARKTFGDGWTEIPVARSSSTQGKGASPQVQAEGGDSGDVADDAPAPAPARRRGSKVRQPPPDSETAPFGDVDEEDMRRWGVHEGSLPCLDGPSAGVANLVVSF
jgi:hypothetical protein